MTPENQKREQHITSMRDEVAHLFLETQLKDLKEEIIAEKGGHPYSPEQVHELSIQQKAYLAGLALRDARNEYTKAA